MTQNQRLVVVRAGDNSLHENWLKPEKYDCIIAYYGDDKNKWRRQDITRIDIKGGKWDGLYQLFNSQRQLLEKYDLIWLPDDDISTNPDAVDHMFALHEQYQLQLSQPALTHDSYFSHFCLLHNPNFCLRFSNFVELMMPCMTADLLRRALPFFENNRTGYMLDKIWHRLPDKPDHAAAILDDVRMHHARRVEHGSLNKKSKLHDGLKILPITPSRKNRRPVIYAGILADGRKINGERALAWPLLQGWGAARQKIKHRPKNLPALLFKQVRYQLTQRADLSFLSKEQISQALS